MNVVTLARHAMACRFEVVLAGETDAARLRAAGEEALGEVERLEAQLSFYRADSEISQINAMAARQPVRVGPEVFALLRRALRLSEDTGGAFDITVGPLVRAWGFADGAPRTPTPEEIERLRGIVGTRHVLLEESDFTVRFDRPGVTIELGAIGKGYAIEQAANVLREAGIDRALIHGGTSTVSAIGAPPDADAWKIAIESPVWGKSAEALNMPTNSSPTMRYLKSAAVKEIAGGTPDRGVFNVELRAAALSVSSPSGKHFEIDGVIQGHVLNPLTCRPAQGGLLAVVAGPSATDTDALSTALLVLGEGGRAQLRSRHPEIRAWFMDAEEELFVDS